ncbi:zinc finger protein AEBP2-like [Paramacrobiotus metropolitanus]|uniref:zinc finger protein AEBP2-like n=1 Tax=Paramacrobiotus metropolitanus TaxID=2943436 RepID=UPI0024463393|nr:zinc finger protein AEBP2-like [Paramacrobiotus metropolitanus]
MPCTRRKNHQSGSRAPRRTVPLQSEDSENMPSSSTSQSVNTHRAGDGGNLNSTPYSCRWRECDFKTYQPENFLNHLRNHAKPAKDSSNGLCLWKNCSACESRQMRLPVLQKHMAETHMPKNQFRCPMDRCNKSCNTPKELVYHLELTNHSAPRKSVRKDRKLDDRSAGQFRSTLITFLGTAAEQQRRKVAMKVQQYLRERGIVYAAHLDEYLVQVYLTPVQTAEGPNWYKVHFPFAQDSEEWVNDIAIEYAQKNQGTKTIRTELPLSNPIFKEPLRWFVKSVVENMEFRNSDVG